MVPKFIMAGGELVRVLVHTGEGQEHLVSEMLKDWSTYSWHVHPQLFIVVAPYFTAAK